MFLKIENILHGHAVSTEQKIPVQSKNNTECTTMSGNSGSFIDPLQLLKD